MRDGAAAAEAAFGVETPLGIHRGWGKVRAGLAKHQQLRHGVGAHTNHGVLGEIDGEPGGSLPSDAKNEAAVLGRPHPGGIRALPGLMRKAQGVKSGGERGLGGVIVGRRDDPSSRVPRGDHGGARDRPVATHHRKVMAGAPDAQNEGAFSPEPIFRRKVSSDRLCRDG
jgi:hypothetical protein